MMFIYERANALEGISRADALHFICIVSSNAVVFAAGVHVFFIRNKLPAFSVDVS